VTDDEKTTVVDAEKTTAEKTTAEKTTAAKTTAAKTTAAKMSPAKTTAPGDEKSDGTTVSDEVEADESDGHDVETAATRGPAARRTDWAKVVAYGLLPALALMLALAAGYLKYVDNSVRDAAVARVESMQAAKDITVAMLSYQPETVDAQLNSARDLLTGSFKGSYTSLINDVVIPGAKQQQISAVATVPRAASVSADPNHAVVLVFVNQTVVVGTEAPTNTASSVRVTLDKQGDKWLISEFQPV
jgi:Mce-associated membrane protein